MKKLIKISMALILSLGSISYGSDSKSASGQQKQLTRKMHTAFQNTLIYLTTSIHELESDTEAADMADAKKLAQGRHLKVS